VSIKPYWRLVTLCLAALTSSATASMELDPSRVQEIAATLPARPVGVGRPVQDRDAWGRLAAQPGFASVMGEAQRLARDPDPELSDDLFLDFSRTGNRDRCQAVLGSRTTRLTTFALAECLEDKGRFLVPLAKTIEVLCSERTWVYPAHDAKLDNFYGRTNQMDLRSTAVGWQLATVDYALNDKLPKNVRDRLRANVERRILEPYRAMARGQRPEMGWMRARHNWNSVCLAGVAGAALGLEESRSERAWFVAAAERYIQYFLEGFPPDGYCVEGMSYWNYGFGHFLMLTETLRQATGGQLDLLANPAALQPSLYCRRAEILNGIYPTIADCHPGVQPQSQFVSYLSQRGQFLVLDSPAAPMAMPVKPAGDFPATLLFNFLPSTLPRVANSLKMEDSPLRTWFKDAGVLLCRPEAGGATAFAVAIKGGENAGNHHHNDVGSFSVVSGKSMVICDPGSEVYTARTFSPQRFDSKVINSYGHAVPVVAGQLQRAGTDTRAPVREARFAASEDTLTLDLRAAYRVPELAQLDRTFVFRRGDRPSLVVRDEVAFTEARSFETALVTWGNWQAVSENELRVTDEAGSVRVRIDTGAQPFKVSAEVLDENVATKVKPRRLAITLQSPVIQAVVQMTFEPEPPKPAKRP